MYQKLFSFHTVTDRNPFQAVMVILMKSWKYPHFTYFKLVIEKWDFYGNFQPQKSKKNVENKENGAKLKKKPWHKLTKKNTKKQKISQANSWDGQFLEGIGAYCVGGCQNPKLFQEFDDSCRQFGDRKLVGFP